MKILNALILLIITGIIIAGCGGGSSGYTGGVSSVEPTSTVIPAVTPAAPSAGGVFKITVNIPDYEVSKKDSLTANVLPYGSKTLRVTITGEAIDPPMVETTPIPSPAPPSVTVTVSNVPVGLNEALLEVLDEEGNVIAHYKHGFYMTSGGTAGPPGVIYLGVVITADGNYRPQNIDVEPGTELYFENWDSEERTVETTPDLDPAMSPIAGVIPAAQPNTAAIYDSKSYTFNTSGIFTYREGDGGRVLVYGSPSLTSIRDTWNATGGDNYDNSDSELTLQFTLSGTNFGDNISMVSGKVEFVNVDTSNILTASVNSSDWTDTEIKGTVTIPASGVSPEPGGRGKYLVRVTVRNSNTDSSMVYYLKGSGNYNITVN